MENKKLTKNKHVVFEVIENEGGVLFNASTKETHLLNLTAMTLFLLCEGKDIEEIHNEYLKMFKDVSVEELKRDFEEAISLFIEKKIVDIY